MKKNSAIVIGINQYQQEQYIQPLRYAQQDAELLHGFLVGSADLAQDDCLLLTDTSPAIAGKATYPTGENIGRWMQDFLGPRGNGLIIFFFSGYGCSYEGHDYLMPIDGDPDNIEFTGISVRSLLGNLQGTGGNVLVLLDLKRSQGLGSSGGVGAETIELARNMSMPTILSCQPHGSSYETYQLRQGFFTAALLEGFRSQQCKTIKDLGDFLSVRLPQLCEHHLQPRQEPVIVVNGANGMIPLWETSKSMSMIGDEQDRELGVNSDAVNGGSTKTSNFNQSVNYKDTHNGGIDGMEKNTDTLKIQSEQNGRGLGGRSTRDRVEPVLLNDQKVGEGNGNSSSLGQEDGKKNGGGISSSPIDSALDSQAQGKFLNNLMVWSGAAALILLGGVFLTNKNLFLAGNSPGNKPVVGKENTQKDNGKKPGKQPVVKNPTDGMKNVEGNKGLEASPVVDQKSTIGPKILAEAQLTLGKISASTLNDAIRKARSVPSNDPVHKDAELSILRWSEMIMDIAEGRAAQNNFVGAMAAAKLVPDINLTLYKEAQDATKEWGALAEEQKINQTKLRDAEKLIRPGVVSSYGKAIDKASTISGDQLGSQEARKSIDEWSAKILEMAYRRASLGQYKEAIAAATLIPDGAKSYDEAQKSINIWQSQIKGR